MYYMEVKINTSQNKKSTEKMNSFEQDPFEFLNENDSFVEDYIQPFDEEQERKCETPIFIEQTSYFNINKFFVKNHSYMENFNQVNEFLIEESNDFQFEQKRSDFEYVNYYESLVQQSYSVSPLIDVGSEFNPSIDDESFHLHSIHNRDFLENENIHHQTNESNQFNDILSKAWSKIETIVEIERFIEIERDIDEPIYFL